MSAGLPIVVFGALLMLWSRTSLTPVKTPAPEVVKSDNKVIVEIVQSDTSA